MSNTGRQQLVRIKSVNKPKTAAQCALVNNKHIEYTVTKHHMCNAEIWADIGDKLMVDVAADGRVMRVGRPFRVGQEFVATLKEYNHLRGFGFFEIPEHLDLFVHFTMVDEEVRRDQLEVGRQFRIRVGEGNKKFHAVVLGCAVEEGVATEIPAQEEDPIILQMEDAMS